MIEPLLHSPVAERIGWVLLHSLWQGVVLALVLLVLSRLVSAGLHAVRHGFATGVLVVWLALPLVTWFQLAPDAVSVPGASPAGVDTVTTAAGVAAVNVASVGEALGSGVPVPAGTAVLVDGASGRLSGLLPYVALAWLVAASLLLLRFAGGLVLVQQLRRSGMPLRWLEASLARLAGRLGVRRRVRIEESSRVDSPSAMGFIRPVILLPASAVTGLSTSQLELILAHELAHVSRNDYLVSLLQGLAEALLFYHPLTWWLSRMLNLEREHACDDLALTATGARRIELAETLARLEGTRPVMRPALSASSNLTQRMWRLLQPGGKASGSRPALVPLALVALGSLWFALADQPAEPVPQWTVVLDAGHSVEFPGASANGVEEAELVLTVTRLVRDALVEHGVDVRLTRDDDNALGSTLAEDLEARASVVTAEVDAFVSIHAGAASSSTMMGILAYVAKSAEQPAGIEPSGRLAEVLLQQMVRETGAPSGPVREQAGFRLLDLVGNAVPAVMLEIGFLSNPEEAELLASSDYQERLAAGIAAGILSHLTEEEQQESEFFVRVQDASGIPVREIPELGWPTFHFLADLTQAVPFKLRAPTWLSDEYGFTTSVWIEEDSTASITYQAGLPGHSIEPSIFVMQTPQSAYERLRIGMDASVEFVSVNGEPAVFAAGSWSAGRTPVWVPDVGGVLVWNEAGMTYVLTMNTTELPLVREVLLRSAGSMIELGSPALMPRDGIPPVSDRIRQWVSVYGDVQVGGGPDGQLHLSGEGFLIVEERSPTGADSHRMLVSLDAGAGETWTYWSNGVNLSVNEDVRDWFAGILSDNVRQKLQEVRDSGAMRATTLALQPNGTRATVIVLSGGLWFDQAGMRQMTVPRQSASALNFEFLTQAYAHGLTSRGLFELTLHYLLPRLATEAVEEARYTIEHVDDPALRSRFISMLALVD